MSADMDSGLSGVLLAVPTLNEEEGLPAVLGQARQLGVTTMVVDAGSTDGTRAVADTYGVPVVEVSRGKGRGWREFLATVPYKDWEYIAMVDGDATYDLAALPRLIEAGADMAVGVRQPVDGSVPRLRAVGAHALSSLAGLCTGRECPDLLSGFRVIRSTYVDRIRLTAERFELETELTMEFLRRGFHVAWVPVNYTRRRGESKLHPVRDGWETLLTIARTLYRKL